VPPDPALGKLFFSILLLCYFFKKSFFNADPFLKKKTCHTESLLSVLMVGTRQSPSLPSAAPVTLDKEPFFFIISFFSIFLLIVSLNML
jgi:hypothetical protein